MELVENVSGENNIKYYVIFDRKLYFLFYKLRKKF